MVPPPSQAGKFKPRKPPKKSKPTAVTTEGSDSTDLGPNAASSTSSSSPARSSSRARGGRGSSGGGRGAVRRGSAPGRGRGRGGKRAPVALPRGAVYFTGNQPDQPTSTAASSKNTASRSSTGGGTAVAADTVVSAGPSTKSKGSQHGQIEVVVGELDVAIGSKASASSSALSSREQPQQPASPSGATRKSTSSARGAVKTSSTLLSIIDTYDSDSSLEELQEKNHQGSLSNVPPPTQLPFPSLQGGPETRQAMYACQMPQVETDSDGLNKPEKQTSTGSLFATQERQDEWSLWQFPTRLPAFNDSTVASGTPVIPDTVASHSSGTSTDPPKIKMDPVTSSVPAASTSASLSAFASELKAYDDSLNTAKAGPLGRLVVYKSGKTVFVMGGRDGSQEIRMDVTEGLSCGFVQQAVSIDTKEGSYVPLGSVRKTIVVAPDVERAFPSGSQ